MKKKYRVDLRGPSGGSFGYGETEEEAALVAWTFWLHTYGAVTPKTSTVKTKEHGGLLGISTHGAQPSKDCIPQPLARHILKYQDVEDLGEELDEQDEVISVLENLKYIIDEIVDARGRARVSIFWAMEALHQVDRWAKAQDAELVELVDEVLHG
jgi:hypothetical protein